MSVRLTQDSKKLNIAAFLPRSRANGPGLRAVVWVQGCARGCPGCFNPEMQPFTEREIVAEEELAGRILAIDGIEGVTFSGGEPFAQAAPLAAVAEKLAAAGLNIVIFTGYTLPELQGSADADWLRLLATTDLLVAGSYVENIPSNRYLCGSDNQQLFFLTDRLKYHPDIKNPNEQLLEFVIDGSGNITVTGFKVKD